MPQRFLDDHDDAGERLPPSKLIKYAMQQLQNALVEELWATHLPLENRLGTDVHTPPHHLQDQTSWLWFWVGVTGCHTMLLNPNLTKLLPAWNNRNVTQCAPNGKEKTEKECVVLQSQRETREQLLISRERTDWSNGLHNRHKHNLHLWSCSSNNRSPPPRSQQHN